jgi:hypothetical protein
VGPILIMTIEIRRPVLTKDRDRLYPCVDKDTWRVGRGHVDCAPIRPATTAARFHT